MKYAILLFPVLIFSVLTAHAQMPESALTKRMDGAVELMEQGKYEEANDEFLYVMKSMTTLPSELAYYFGRNSYHIEKYKQSINWLNKYIQLKGTQGRFYDEAVKYLQLAEDQYLDISRARAQAILEDFGSADYDCGGLAKMICPVCKGEGVVVTQGPFELIYKTCPYSAGEAFLTCEEYNLFMRGEMEPKIK